MPKKFTKAQFIEKARSVHGNKYIYDGLNYLGIKKEIQLQCPIHNNFNLLAYNHLYCKIKVAGWLYNPCKIALERKLKLAQKLMVGNG